MAQTIQVRARLSVTYRGQTYAPGTLFRATIPDALSLRHRRRVDLAPYAKAPAVPPPAPAPPTVEDVPPTPPLTETTEPTEIEHTETDTTDTEDSQRSESKPGRRRRYSRRDLTAES